MTTLWYHQPLLLTNFYLQPVLLATSSPYSLSTSFGSYCSLLLSTSSPYSVLPPAPTPCYLLSLLLTTPCYLQPILFATSIPYSFLPLVLTKPCYLQLLPLTTPFFCTIFSVPPFLSLPISSFCSIKCFWALTYKFFAGYAGTPLCFLIAKCHRLMASYV